MLASKSTYRDRAIARAAKACDRVKADYVSRLDELLDDLKQAAAGRRWKEVRDVSQQIAGEAPSLDAPVAGALARDLSDMLKPGAPRAAEAADTAVRAIGLAISARLTGEEPVSEELRAQVSEMKQWAVKS